MKVLLMPPLISLVKDSPSIPDLGLGYLAASLIKKGHPVQILGWNMNPSREAFQRYLGEYQPNMVGIKVFTKDLRAAAETIAIIESADPNIHVIVGGPHPSAETPERIMEDLRCDFAFQGEAEIGLPRLVEVLGSPGISGRPMELSRGDCKEIPGLVWRKGEKILSNPKSFVKDLDSFGFPPWGIMKPEDHFSPLIGERRRGHEAPVILTRGCPGNCIFCSAFHVNGKIVRSRSSQDFIAEIQLLYERYGVRQFVIADNCFTHHKKMLKEVCNFLIELNLDILFDCVSYNNLRNLDMEMLPLLKKAGCTLINMGIESGSEKIRQSLGKHSTLDQVKEKVALIRNYGIKVRAFFMIGFPGETRLDIKDSFRFARSLKIEDVHFEICFPLPGSMVYRYVRDKYNIDHIPWADFDIYRSPYPASELSSGALHRILRKYQLAEALKSRDIPQIIRSAYDFLHSFF